VSLIQNNAGRIVRQWTDRLQSDPTTETFSEVDLRKFEFRALEMLSQVGQWVGYETDKCDVGKRYAAEGIGLFKMGIPLCEGIRAIILLKRTIWLYVVYDNMLDTVIELTQLRELNDRLTLFFDRAEYYFIRGYTEEMNRRMKEIWRLGDSETDKIFFGRSFYCRNQKPLATAA
jgi:hypothetical protein